MIELCTAAELPHNATTFHISNPPVLHLETDRNSVSVTVFRLKSVRNYAYFVFMYVIYSILGCVGHPHAGVISW